MRYHHFNLLLLFPPIGFFCYWLGERDDKSTDLFIFSASLFFFTFLSHIIAYLFIKFSPFFLEPFFQLFFKMTTMTCVIFYTVAFSLEMIYPTSNWIKTYLTKWKNRHRPVKKIRSF